MSRRTLLVVGLLVALLLAGVVSYYASGDPDGLETVARDQGIAQQERRHDLDNTPLRGYQTSGVDNDRLSRGLAGVVGVLLTFAIAGGLALAVRRSRSSDEEDVAADRTDSERPATSSRR